MIHDIRDYGAKGDGTTDDSPAIRAAIDVAGDGTVYLPSGIYTVGRYGHPTPTIELGSRITLRGDGASTVIRRAVRGSEAPLIHAQDVEGVTIADLALDGNKGSTTAYASNEQGLWLSRARDCVISRVWSYGQRTNGIVLEYCQGVSVSQCIVRDNLKNGIYLTGSDHVMLSGCLGHGNGSSGVGSSFGIACSWHCALSACAGWGDVGAALTTGRDTQYLSVTGGSYEGVDVSAEPVGLMPATFDRDGASGPYDGKTKLGTSNSVFTGLIVANTLHHGIRFFGGSGNLVTGCIVRRIGLNGIMLYGSKGNTIRGNLISDVGKAEIKDYQAGIVVVADPGWPDATGNVLDSNELPEVAQPVHVYAIPSGSVAGTIQK